MINKELISIVRYRNIKATIYGLFVLVLFIGVNIFMINSISNGNDIRNIQRENITQTYMIVLWILIIISIVWSYKIAKQTGREPVLWVVIGLMAGSIGLLIISLKDYYIKDIKIQNIIITTRQEFKEKLKRELGRIKDKELKKKKRFEITQEFQKLLVERCSKEITDEKVKVLKELVDKGIIDKNTDLTEKARIIEKMNSLKMTSSDEINWEKEWIENESVCPACGAELEENSDYCLDCGLKIK